MSIVGSSDWTRMAHWQRWSLGVGIVVLCLCAIDAVYNPAPLLRAYLAAYLFYLGIALGSMALLMAYHLTGGSWGLMIRRILEAEMRTLPLLAVFFLPVAGGIRYLYVWAQPAAVAASPKLQYQQFYLQPMYFWTRAALYFAIWLFMVTLLSRWSRKEDRSGDPRLAWKSLKFSGFGAVVYGISIHFAAVDWGMSLQPVFHSTIWGPLFVMGQLLSAFTVALIVLAVWIDRPPLREVASLHVRNDLGSLLLTLLILWAYMAWFQFMLVWIANLPVDVIWYVPRTSSLWKGMMWAVFSLHFVIPFFLLLMRGIKRNSTTVAWIAGLILFMQLVFMYYQIMPGLSADEIGQHWMDFLTPIGIGGVWLAYFLRQLQRLPLLALNDYNRMAALRLHQLDEDETTREEVLAYE